MKSREYVLNLNTETYNKHAHTAFKICKKNKYAAEEALQNSFVNLLSSDNDMALPTAYTGQSIFNAFRRSFRVSSKYTQLTDYQEPSYLPDYTSNQYLLDEAINSLSEKQRDTVKQFLQYGSFAEIARQTGKNLNTIKSVFRMATLNLLVKLNKEDLWT